MIQVAEGANQSLLHDFLAQVSIAADAIQAEAVQGLQQGIGHHLHGGGVARGGHACASRRRR